MKPAFLVPFAVFVVIAGFLLVGLNRDPGLLPSVLIDQPVPAFTTPVLPVAPGASAENAAADASGSFAGSGSFGDSGSFEDSGSFAAADMIGQVWVLNIWASWCVACVAEHKVITALTEQSSAPVVGLNYKDNDADAVAWLQRFGNPYNHVPTDSDGRIGIDFGLYGVPETFVVDKSGKIRYKHVGPVDQKALDEKLLPLIVELQGASS